MTAIATFTTALAGLNVTGVKREFAYPPASLNSEDMPAQWVQLPTIIDDNPRTFTQHGDLWGTLTGQLVIAVIATGQGTQASNFAATLAMMDVVRTALAASAQTAAKGKITYVIRQGEVLVAETAYWAVIAEVTAHG